MSLVIGADSRVVGDMGFGVRRAAAASAAGALGRELVVLGRLGLFRGGSGSAVAQDGAVPWSQGAQDQVGPSPFDALAGAAGRCRGGVWGWRRGMRRSPRAAPEAWGGSAVTVGARIGATLVAGRHLRRSRPGDGFDAHVDPRTSMSACRTCSVRPPLRKALRSRRRRAEHQPLAVVSRTWAFWLTRSQVPREVSEDLGEHVRATRGGSRRRRGRPGPGG